MLKVVIPLILISGSSALGLEVFWLRSLSHILGSTSVAVSIVFGMFLFSLSLGSLLSTFWNGPSSFFNRYPILSFGILESLGVLLGVFSNFLAFYHEDLFFNFINLIRNDFISSIAISFFFITPSVFLLGMGFPVILSSLEKKQNLSTIYSLNTIGGAIGTLAYGIIFPYFLGYGLSLLILCSFTLILLFISIRNGKEESLAVSEIDEIRFPREKGFFLALFSGFVFMMGEIAGDRLVRMILGDRSYISLITLFFFLIVISMAAGIKSYINNLKKVVILSLFLCLFSLVVILLFKNSALLVTRDYQVLNSKKLIFLLFGICPLFMGLGLVFPSCLDLINSSVQKRSKLAFYLSGNTFMALVASLITTHLLFSVIGIHGIFAVLTMALVIFPLLMNQCKAALLILPISIILSLFYLKSPFSISERKNVLYQSESQYSHFSIIEKEGFEETYSGNTRLIAPYIAKNLEHAQQALAYFPALYKKNVENSLVIGAGYGITIDAFLKVSTESTYVVEILNEIIFNTNRYKELNNNWQRNKKIKLQITDGVRYVSITDKKFDIISVSLDHPYSFNGSRTITKEFYQHVSEKLVKNGIYSQMIWGEHLPEILATVKTVFPYIKIMPAYSDSDFIIIASKEALVKQRSDQAFSKVWKKLNDKRKLRKNLQIGREALKKISSQPHRFIISRLHPIIEFGNHESTGFFWIRR